MGAAVGLAAPADLVVAKPYINSGAPAGPLTPAVGDLVATPKGYRSLALEGFSEDLNQDGFVDPIGQAVQVVHTPVVAAPAIQYVAAPAVKPVEVKAVEVKAAPAVTLNVAPAATVPVQHLVHTAPHVAVQKHVTTHTTHHVINHAPVIGS